MGLVYRKRDFRVKTLTNFHTKDCKIYGNPRGVPILLKGSFSHLFFYLRGSEVPFKDLVEIPLPPSFVGT